MGQKFFISFNSKDRKKAEWIGLTLENAGHEVAVHTWEVPAGGNASIWINQQLDSADRLIAVISPDYLDAVYSAAEWAATVWDDPQGIEGLVIPVVVRQTKKLPPLLRPLSRIDLTGIDENEAERRLLDGLTMPGRPLLKPAFDPVDPSISERAPIAKPTFARESDSPESTALTGKSERSGNHARPKVGRTLSVFFDDWLEVDTTRLTKDAFDISESTRAFETLQLEVSAPKLDGLINCIKEQSKTAEDSHQVADQRRAIKWAEENMRECRNRGTVLFCGLCQESQADLAAESLSWYLRLVMAETLYNLAKRQCQTQTIAYFSGFSGWSLKGSGWAKKVDVVQYVYSLPEAAETLINSDSIDPSFFATGAAIVYLPQRIVNPPDEPMDAPKRFTERGITATDWIKFVVPQMHNQPKELIESHIAYTSDSSSYLTTGRIFSNHQDAPST